VPVSDHGHGLERVASTRGSGWILAGAVTAALLAGVGVTLAVLAPVGAPIAVPAASPAPSAIPSIGPAPTARPETTPAPPGTQLTPPDVGDYVAPSWLAERDEVGRGVILSRVVMGEVEGDVVWGALLDTGDVCLSASSEQGGGGQCAAYAQFVESGLTLDQGAWSVHWTADGTVTWEGVS